MERFRLPITLINGMATSHPINSLNAGNHTISAVYSGDAFHRQHQPTALTIARPRSPSRPTISTWDTAMPSRG